MIHYAATHSELLLLFVTTPLLGWLIHDTLGKQAIFKVIAVCVILILPVVTGYNYIVANAYAYLLYIIIGCAYSFLLINKLVKIYLSIVLTVFLLIAWLPCLIFSLGSGTLTVQQRWEFKDYNVEYIRDQGFAGGPLMKYELNKYGIIPIFIKHVDNKIDNDTTNNCIVQFSYENFSFNKCKQ